MTGLTLYYITAVVLLISFSCSCSLFFSYQFCQIIGIIISKSLLTSARLVVFSYSFNKDVCIIQYGWCFFAVLHSVQCLDLFND